MIKTIAQSASLLTPHLSVLILLCSAVTGVQPATAHGADASAAISPLPLRPFLPQAADAPQTGLPVQLDPTAFEALKTGPHFRQLFFPISTTEQVTLDLTRFEVLSPSARVIIAGPRGSNRTQAPDVVLLRGAVLGQPDSHAFVALASSGATYARVTLADGRQFVLEPSTSDGRRADGSLLIHSPRPGSLPEFDTFCGADHAALPVRVTPLPAARGSGGNPGPRIVVLAIDADQAYVNLFPDTTAAQDYAVALIAAISDIYIRDLNCKLVIDFLRLWPDGGEPFGADDLPGFAGHWLDNEDMTGINLVHLMSGRRDTSYGGVAYVAGACSGVAFAISAYMLGAFPNPPGAPHLFNWDLIVVAHEMGHNMGTYHTHDGYTPHIDDCASGLFSLGTIMSYCHTLPGGTLNIDLRFHSRVQDVVEQEIVDGACLVHDCNDNGVDDSADVAGATSADANSNGVPDECEDCNSNGTLDDLDIIFGGSDVDNDGVPDECQADCDGNGVPDTWDIVSGSADENGNRTPDGCEPDCDGSGTADWIEIDAETLADLDRNRVPDTCEDCDTNGVTDWIDLGRPFNVYVAQLNDRVREYHGLSGVPVRDLGVGVVLDPYDVVLGPDGALYVASFGNSRIARIDIGTGTATVFVSTGSGGLSGPAGVVFGANGNLFVSSNGTSSVIEYDGASGALVGTFVVAGSGGLTGPQGLSFGPNGNLFVTSGNNAVLEYDAVSGAFVGQFVTPGSGGLSGPRGMAWMASGHLLVASTSNDQVLEYDAGGSPLGAFNDAFVPTGAWGVRVGPNGNVFVVRNTGTVRVVEYDAGAGRYVRSFIRGDTGLVSPTGLAFGGEAVNDCNANLALDACDIAEGGSADTNGNDVPDECEALGCVCGDLDGMGANVDLSDFAVFATCFGLSSPSGGCDAAALLCADLDGSGSVTLSDFSTFALLFGGAPAGTPPNCL